MGWRRSPVERPPQCSNSKPGGEQSRPPSPGDELKGGRGCTKQHRGNRRQILPADFHPRAFGAAGGREPEYFRRTNLGCGRECGKQEEAAAGRLREGDPGNALWWKQSLSSTSGSHYVKVTRDAVMYVTLFPRDIDPQAFPTVEARRPPDSRRALQVAGCGEAPL